QRRRTVDEQTMPCYSTSSLDEAHELRSGRNSYAFKGLAQDEFLGFEIIAIRDRVLRPRFLRPSLECRWSNFIVWGRFGWDPDRLRDSEVYGTGREMVNDERVNPDLTVREGLLNL